MGGNQVGQMAAVAARLLGAEHVIIIDRYPERLDMVEERLGLETLDYGKESVVEALRELTGGRSPDACIEAVGHDLQSCRSERRSSKNITSWSLKKTTGSTEGRPALV